MQIEQACALLTKYPSTHCTQLVELGPEQLMHCAITEEQDKQVEELIVRYRPAVLLH